MIYVLTEIDPVTNENSGYVKIGYIKADAEKRANELSCGNPRQLVVIATCEGELTDEHALHVRFWQWRIEGTEWFRLVAGSDLDTWLEALRSASVSAAQLRKDRAASRPWMWRGKARSRERDLGPKCEWCGARGHATSDCPKRAQWRYQRRLATSSL